MTAGLVAGVAQELDARRGRRVRSVHQDAALQFRVELQGRGERADWVIDLQAPFPHTHLAAHRRAPPQPSALAQALRGELAGGAILAAWSVPGDRALAVRLAGRSGTRTVWVELFGGQANLYVLDQAGAVLLTPRGAVARRRGAAQGATFVPAPEREADRGVPPRDASAEVRARLTAWRRDRELTAARRRLRRWLAAQTARAERRREALEAGARGADEAAEHQRRGELLQGAFHLLRPGLRAVRVTDYRADPPVEVELSLDPDLPPGEQVAACFRAARRCRRAAQEAERRLPIVRAQLRALQEARDALAAAPDPAALERIAAGFPEPLAGAAQAALRAPRPRDPQRAPAAARAWRTFVSSDGWAIHVGRDARGNDRLTLHVAKPWDLFLHVRAATGSHVLVPTPRGKSVPKETLLDAAELACLFSDRRDAEHNEVDYVQCRHVRKPRGAPPGTVLVERARTLAVRRDPERRTRLRASRESPRGGRPVT